MDHAALNRAINWRATPFQLQGRWTFKDFHGRQWPVFFKTKRETMAMGDRHIAAVLANLSTVPR